MSQEFDPYAQNYGELLNDALSITGFDSSFFLNAKLRKLRQLLKPSAENPLSFLDYGCGSGGLCGLFHQYFPGAGYHGVDISSRMIEQARSQYGQRGAFFAMDNPDWRRKQYDVVFAAGVFHHIPPGQHPAILSGLVPLLTPAGKIIVWEHNPLNPFTRKVVRDCAFDQNALLIQPAAMRQLLIQTGCASAEVVFTTFFPKFMSALLPLENFLGWLPLGGQYVAIGARQRP